MTFQSTVLYIAIVVLIISLIFIGISLYNTTGAKFPPVASKCPDYFEIENNTCKNKHGIGTQVAPHCPARDEFLSLSDVETPCTKYKRAKKCKLTWNGITNASPAVC
jgi:hypothetical protein